MYKRQVISLLTVSFIGEKIDPSTNVEITDTTGVGAVSYTHLHGVRSNREVQSTELTGHGHTVQAGFHHGVEMCIRDRSMLGRSP